MVFTIILCFGNLLICLVKDVSCGCNRWSKWTCVKLVLLCWRKSVILNAKRLNSWFLAEDLRKIVPLFSFIRFNTTCFLFLECCCVCNPRLHVRNIMPPYKESIGLPTTSKKMLVHFVVFNKLTYFYFFFYLSLSISGSQWIRFHF